MLDILPGNRERIRGSRNVALQGDTENLTDGAHTRRGSLKVYGNIMNSYTQNQVKTAVITLAHSKDRRLRNISLHDA